jgi:hypothetical protein
MQELVTEDMARIVSRVTEPVLGVTFVPAANGDAAIGDEWKTAALPIDGTNPLTVAVSADDACARVLGGNMFGMDADKVDEAMVADALCELVNMTAGLLKSAMSIDQSLGLPSMRPSELFSADGGSWKHHYLRAGALNLVLAIATRIH